ncbi:hypothetical protein AUJ16_01605 [Candidatus Micrarchaeota archaeon CG1_02_60_51]|nr:MAG: hypothetical protein AUJ16_01605 [Candidatus Micrarchaeota archaeon CG1_02_60_51]
MADVKDIVKKMLEQGLNGDQIRANLDELGFANSDEVIRQVAGEAKPEGEGPAGKPKQDEPAGFMMTAVGKEGDEKELKFESAGANGLFTETKQLNTEELERKVDDVLARLKAIQDLNKKILEANQALLAKIK